MATTIRRGLSTLALASGLVVGTAGVATAQSLNVVDDRGDVVSLDSATEEQTPRPTVSNGDILRTVLSHGERRVSIRIKFADLRRVGQVRTDGVRVVTNEGVRRTVSVFASQGAWGGQSEMSRPNGATVRCAVRHQIDYVANVTTVSFPRSCVSDPRWVRLGVGSAWSEDQFQTVYADDAQIDGRINPATVRLSPRLRRG